MDIKLASLGIFISTIVIFDDVETVPDQSCSADVAGARRDRSDGNMDCDTFDRGASGISRCHILTQSPPRISHAA
jgi:hypothetical protein